MSVPQSPRGPMNGGGPNPQNGRGPKRPGSPFDGGNRGNGNSGPNGNGGGDKRPVWQSPWLWAVILVVLVLAGMQVFSGPRTQTIDTADGMNLLYGAVSADGDVDEKKADHGVLPYDMTQKGLEDAQKSNGAKGGSKSDSNSSKSDAEGDAKDPNSGDQNKGRSDQDGQSAQSGDETAQPSAEVSVTGLQAADGQIAVKPVKSGDTVKVVRASIVDNSQMVKLKLNHDFIKPKDSKTGREHNYGREVQFYYTRAQETQVVSAVHDAKPTKGWDTEIAQDNIWVTLAVQFLPIILLLVLFWWIFSRMSNGGGAGLLGMGGGKSSSKLLEGQIPTTKFSDVAGEQSAVEEVEEIKDFLKDPSKYKALGARIPSGVLLYGPPGTGKTLLARAIAGEAGVPFYAMAGSDFVEMFVGLGASRVRDLFEEAKKNAPAIIFIDEIDAVGRKRGSGNSGGHDEREQTLNQLLVEMDGFNNDTNLIIIAATNRPDVLDSALLRPGRFDRQVAVEAPDLDGREAILKVHAKGKPFVPDVDLHTVAVRTPGFTGADLANVLNEAALLCARSGAQLIDNRAIDEAIDRVQSGPRRQSRGMALDELRNTAYHEGGHALVAAAMHHTDPVTKVTILPRGRALGYTAVMPTTDRYSQSREELLDQMAYAMGGRTSEEVVFHDPTTGASNDIEKATEIARKMVMEFGLSSKLGSVKWGEAQPEQDSMDGLVHKYSDKTAEAIDEEVYKLLENAHTEAWRVITENREVLDELVRQLLVKETLNEKELAEIFKNLRMSPERKTWLSDSGRPDSDLPPVPIPESLSKSLGGK